MIFDEEGIKSKPVMTSCLHSYFHFRILSEFFQKQISVVGSVTETKALKDDVFSGNVRFFADVVSEIKHTNHLHKFILARGTPSNKRHCLIVDTKLKQHPTYSQSVYRIERSLFHERVQKRRDDTTFLFPICQLYFAYNITSKVIGCL